MPDRPTTGLAVGDEVEVEVTAFAHGGHCIARHDGQVLFVRHTLPGERVLARVTETGAGERFVRADAVSVTISGSPHSTVAGTLSVVSAARTSRQTIRSGR
jgi:tRNA/tmRNA/rRNA uracil-C5-methylase (TrmA/RlmC/RlmD family)